MPLKILFTHAAQCIRSLVHPCLSFLSLMGAACLLFASNSLLFPGEAMAAATCKFLNPGLTTTITQPSQVVIIPGGTVYKFTFDFPLNRQIKIEDSPTGCDHDAQYSSALGGLQREIGIYFYPSPDYYQYVSADTIRIGSTGFGLKLVSPAPEQSFQSAPLRMMMGKVGFSGPTIIHPSSQVEYDLATHITLELVVLDSSIPFSGDTLPLGSGDIFGIAKLGYDICDGTNNGLCGNRDLTSPDLYIVKWSNPNIPISQTTCVANIPPVSLGTHNMSAGGPGSTSPKTSFSIILAECPTNVPLKYRIDPSTAILSGIDPSLMALDSTSSATGVAIQLLNNNDIPLPLGALKLFSPNNPSPDVTIPLAARYYKTGSSVTPGSANASATLTITHD